MSDADAAAALEQTIARYNEAWNAHDLDVIMSMHAPDMVFENHTAGERAEGEAARQHIGGIFETWPDISFATHAHPIPRSNPRQPGQLPHSKPEAEGRSTGD